MPVCVCRCDHICGDMFLHMVASTPRAVLVCERQNPETIWRGRRRCCVNVTTPLCWYWITGNVHWVPRSNGMILKIASRSALLPRPLASWYFLCVGERERRVHAITLLLRVFRIVWCSSSASDVHFTHSHACIHALACTHICMHSWPRTCPCTHIQQPSHTHTHTHTGALAE